MRLAIAVLSLARRLPPSLLLGVVAGCHSQHRATTAVPAPADSVAVGYGMQANRDVTGSISSVDGDVARRSSPTTVIDMLDGRFAGVEVRRSGPGGATIRVRGQRSMLADAEPLLVIDGIPQHAAAGAMLADLDPRDVKSIDVLKDAAATSVYGSRGANGVILITMRHPR